MRSVYKWLQSRRMVVLGVVAVSIWPAPTKATVWSGSFSGEFTLDGNWNGLLKPTATDAADFTSAPIVPNTFVNLSANRNVLSMQVVRQAGVSVTNLRAPRLCVGRGESVIDQ